MIVYLFLLSSDVAVDKIIFQEVNIMACFIVPVTEAVVTTIAGKALESKEKEVQEADVRQSTTEVKIPFTRKLKWLTNLLWGGSALLAFEHFWHGELVPFFPFLTAMNNPADTAKMLHEMALVGGTMAVWITVIWAGIVVAADHIVKRPAVEDAELKEV